MYIINYVHYIYILDKQYINIFTTFYTVVRHYQLSYYQSRFLSKALNGIKEALYIHMQHIQDV